MKDTWRIIHLYRDTNNAPLKFMCGASTDAARRSGAGHVHWYTNPLRGNFGKVHLVGEKVCEACAALVTPLELLAGADL